MNNNNKNIIKSPIIFKKKLNDFYKSIPLKRKVADMGDNKHFPPAHREWYNSIYTYNNNYIKNLPIFDKNIIKIIRSYFNFFISEDIIKSKFRYIKIKLKGTIRKKRLFNLYKIYVSKAEIKHFNSKVIITLYVYNEEKYRFLLKIKKLSNILFNDLSLSLKKEISRNYKLIKPYNYMITLGKLYRNMFEINNYLSKDLVLKLRRIIKELFIKRIVYIVYYRLKLNYNKSKFEEVFLNKLGKLISRFYNKQVEFNIINIKNLTFNTDIFTQIIASKLGGKRGRKRSIFRAIILLLRNVNLTNINSITEKYKISNNKNMNILSNILKNLNINKLINLGNNKDSLNNLITKYYPNNENDIKDIIFNNIKYKNMGGLKIELKGRLTKRFRADRSLFKVKWKGGLKNIDSSYKGLSSVILRGHMKPNVDYTFMKSKRRIGAFGVKGWISGK
jgi:hypothetical protein